MATDAKNVSSGVYGYLIGAVLGVVISGVTGTLISLLGNISLGVAFYFMYKTFTAYQSQGRFPKKPSIKLFIGVGICFLGNFIDFANNTTTTFISSIITLVGFIMLLIGFKELRTDIQLVSPPGSPAQQSTLGAPTPGVEPQVIKTVETTTHVEGTKFCANCGAKNATTYKFCANCGATLE
ncbi:MAG: DUF7577 domain-containing protein [Candidatus Heimdallarchaeaceae archaeon]